MSSITLPSPELFAGVRGRVITPDDEDYDRARTVFIGGFDRRPTVIVRAADETDVARVVTVARETGLELAVRSGGHSLAAHGVSDGGIVLDLTDMRALDIDPENRTAWAQAGSTTGAYTKAAGEHGLATGFGDTASVGIGGLTLGGGVGLLSRKFGLTIDDLLAADVVTADGEILRVDAEMHPDLFWAIRGGGGNFGVATRFRFRLHEVPTVMGGTLILPATPEVIAAFIAEAEAASDDLTTIANVMPAPPMPFVPSEHHGRLVIMALLAWAGPVDEGESAVAPFRAMAPPLADMVRQMRYLELFELFPEQEEFHPVASGHTMFLDTVDLNVAATIVDHLEAGTAMMNVAQLRVLGGAVARVPSDATAYAHRASRIMAHLSAAYANGDERSMHDPWVGGFASALHQRDPAAYVNFLGAGDEDRIRDAYPGATWDRLRAVKARYDPTNLFRLNQNVPPPVG
jgi:hypothetical protein